MKKNAYSFKKLAPYIVLIICLLVTFYSRHSYSEHLKEKDVIKFNNLINETTSAIISRLYDYETILRGGAALFAAQGEVSREQWRTFVDNLRVWERYPGIQGIGFSKLIQPYELQAHTAEIRAQGFPNYTVRPEGKREIYTSIIYLEPFDKRNQRAFGYDMFSESTRRDAMERARDTDKASMSGKVKLLQETETDAQPGFLIYVAVYKKGMSVSNIQERKTALLGYVYSPFRIKDLMNGILKGSLKDIDLEIYDGVDISKNSFMYDTDENKYALIQNKQRLLTDKKFIDLYGHQWTLYYSSLPSFGITYEKYLPTVILIAGTIMSFLIFLLMQSQEKTRERAIEIADDMTAALRDSEQKYRVLNDVLPIGVSIIGLNMEILAANKTKRNWFPESEHIQPPVCYSVYNIPPGTEPCKGCPVVMTFKDGQTHKAEREARTSQGIKTLLITTAPITGPDGKVVSVHETVEDITERKKLDELIREYSTSLEKEIEERTKELKDANTKLEALNNELEAKRQEAEQARFQALAASRAKSDFLANMSHELRTPLNSVIGFAELLQDELYGKLNAEQKEQVSFILASGRHLLHLINDILDLSKVESGKMELELETFMLTDVINSALTMLKEKAMKHYIKLNAEIEDEADIEIEADERKLKQIMFNLLSNAVKFTPEGGSVFVEARKLSSSEFGVRSSEKIKDDAESGAIYSELRTQYSEPDRDFIEITVVDTGIGIKPEDLDKLFKEFSQLESPYDKKHEGTGLGLALTKKLVELHGGSIWVESEYEKGSRFTFVIPIKQK